MATINGVTVAIARGVYQTTWASMANGDVGTVLDAPHLGDKTVIIRGTFGSGGTVVIEGSYSGNTSYSTLTGNGGSLSFTAAGQNAILENVGTIRPRVSAGDGTTSLTVVVISLRE